jgi:FdhD protein
MPQPESNLPSEGVRHYSISQYEETEITARDDVLAVEEPMEIRVVTGPAEKRTSKSLAITMRTPDHDFELAAGFLFTEGIVTGHDQIRKFEHCGPIAADRLRPNIVSVELADDIALDFKLLQRHFYTTSSCGICGKASLDALEAQKWSPVQDTLQIRGELICDLPNRLKREQSIFQSTGGIHAAGLFDRNGELICCREDVGRHNALDKLIGRQFLDGKLPLSRQVLVVSGRASFELLQKSLAAAIPIVVAVGAPSSLAVDLARRFEMTLIGFTTKQRFNVYSRPDRCGRSVV